MKLVYPLNFIIVKNFLKENWFKIATILLAFLSFYWFEYRTEEARRKCSYDAQASVNRVYPSSSEKGTDAELRLNQIFYQGCMRSQFGLNP